jgi:hypothetical protein
MITKLYHRFWAGYHSLAIEFMFGCMPEDNLEELDPAIQHHVKHYKKHFYES